jgi:phosphoglycerol transferase MdoB-like AlkP superfamily enzyme
LPWPRRYAVLAAVLAAVAGLWLTSAVANTRVSAHRVANQCAGNGWYSFVYYAWTCKFDYEHFYVTVDRDDAYDRVRQRIVGPNDRRHVPSTNPLDRTVHSPGPRRDYNVVLILEESFGSDFVGVLGDTRGLTPRFDALAREGILFDNFYATGNRTARALEAVLTSLPPIPTESILKRDHSQHIYTLAHVLAERGYRRLFMTGGQGLFDGVQSFMSANGFDLFFEEDDFADPEFTNAWGVSDEDLFAKAVVELDRLDQEDRPFFATLLTVSNHLPYTYPAGRIARPPGERKRENAVQYADWALGEFFQAARRREFYRNTLFVVMGDHGARVYGRQLFPIKSYRVPALMILPGGERQGTRTSTLASSLDIAPTIMGILGGEYRSVFFGRDVLNTPAGQGYALMQHNHDVALLSANHELVVLGSQKAVSGFRLNPATFDLVQLATPNRELVMDAISFYQSANRLYYDEHCFPDSRAATRGALAE